MTSVVRRTAVPALVLALVPASAGTSAPPPRVALTAVPAHVMLEGNARTSIRVRNSGTTRVAVHVSRAGFALDRRGRPRITRGGVARSAARWLTVRPTHFTLGPRSTASLSVTATPPRRAAPGDHDALMLLRTQAPRDGRVGVRLRMGIVVVVRTRGRIVRRLELGGVRVARRETGRVLAFIVSNRGNVTETLTGARAVLSRPRSGRRVGTLVASKRDLRPLTSGILEFRLGASAPGRIAVRVVIPPEPGRDAVQRSYRIRL